MILPNFMTDKACVLVFAVTAAFFIIGICVTGIAGKSPFSFHGFHRLIQYAGRQFGLGTHAWLLNLGTIYQQMEKLVQVSISLCRPQSFDPLPLSYWSEHKDQNRLTL